MAREIPTVIALDICVLQRSLTVHIKRFVLYSL